MKTLNEQIERLRELIRKCYEQVLAKNGTIPEVGERNMENLPQSIDTISVLVEKNDVNFYDYDGTRLFSYTKDEFLSLTELPTVGDIHEDITFEDWTHGLQESQEYVAKYGILDIGSYWCTKDNSIILKAHTYYDFEAYGTFTTKGGSNIVVDWGDGIVETYPSGSSIGHVYNNDSYKVLRFKAQASDDYITRFGWHQNFCRITEELNYSKYSCRVQCSDSYQKSPMLKRVTVNAAGFGGSRFSSSLECAIVPYSFQELSGARIMIFPFTIRGNKYYSATNLSNANSVERICLPENVDSTLGLTNAYALREMPLSNNIKTVTAIGFRSFQGRTLDLRDNDISVLPTNFAWSGWFIDVLLPRTLTQLAARAFNNTLIDGNVVLSDKVTLVENGSLQQAYGDVFIYVKDVNTIRCAHPDAVNSAKTIHVLPDSIYIDTNGSTYYGVEAWEHATNWSSYVGKYIADADKYDFEQND